MKSLLEHHILDIQSLSKSEHIIMIDAAGCILQRLLMSAHDHLKISKSNEQHSEKIEFYRKIIENHKTCLRSIELEMCERIAV